ncbi:hypothetical protein EVAR_88074_1 [Eumeta japonica]|uniref:Uncharacterized protein n=1 Tax=Eumeta variegata TaxID=151549 RepID=A0A4C1WIR7_EUMVA|nr:hypothetical protein EVAR_88074_1 [Eumeta japonica]
MVAAASRPAARGAGATALVVPAGAGGRGPWACSARGRVGSAAVCVRSKRMNGDDVGRAPTALAGPPSAPSAFGRGSVGARCLLGDGSAARRRRGPDRCRPAAVTVAPINRPNPFVSVADRQPERVPVERSPARRIAATIFRRAATRAADAT